MLLPRIVRIPALLTLVSLWLIQTETLSQSVLNSTSYDASRWILIKRGQAQLGKSETAEVVLLKSRVSTGRGGAEQLLSDVQLLITRNGEVLFDYKKTLAESSNETRFFMDDVLIVRDVTSDGTPEIIFHSGNLGASDYIALEHILRYDRKANSFIDVAPAEFFSSGTHAVQWLIPTRRAILVIGRRGEWPVSTPPVERCHYCASKFVFDAYEWDAANASFALVASVSSKDLHGSGSDALKTEWSYIRTKLLK